MESYLTPIWYWMCLIAKLNLISECAVYCNVDTVLSNPLCSHLGQVLKISDLNTTFAVPKNGHRLQDLWFLEKKNIKCC